jgi:DNA-binding CsgD family transcriptional regulator
MRSVTKGATALSARQAEIAQLVATGKSNREIADGCR